MRLLCTCAFIEWFRFWNMNIVQYSNSDTQHNTLINHIFSQRIFIASHSNINILKEHHQNHHINHFEPIPRDIRLIFLRLLCGCSSQRFFNLWLTNEPTVDLLLQLSILSTLAVPQWLQPHDMNLVYIIFASLKHAKQNMGINPLIFDLHQDHNYNLHQNHMLHHNLNTLNL